MGILKVGTKDIIRNKGKSIVAVIGIIVSIVLISGINISTASLTTYNIKNSISEIYVDIQVSSDSNDTEGLMDTLNRVKDYDPIIQDIMPCYSRSFNKYFGKLLITTNDTIDWDTIIADNFDEKYFLEYATLNGVDMSFFTLERFEDAIEIYSGRLPYNDGEIILDHNTFSGLNLNLNDTITIGTYITFDILTLNYTISNLTVVGTFKINHYAIYQFFANTYSNENILITNFDYVKDLHANFTYFNDTYSLVENGPSLINYNILIDHNSLNVFNYGEIVDQINRIITRVYIEDDSGYDLYVDSRLLRHLSYTKEFMDLFGLLLLVISLPVYILGLYLSRTLFSISLDKQETKIGQFLSKGASKKQIYSWIITESIFYSIIGGLLGVLGGYFLSHLIIYSIIGPEFNTFLIEIGINLNPFTIFFSVIIAILFVLIALIKPLKELSKKSINVTSKTYLDNTEDTFKSNRDWVLFIMGIVPIVFSIILSPEFINQTPLEIQIILVNVMVFVTGWTAASTFLITYSIVKIITTRYNEQFIKFTKKIIKPFSTFNYELISRNLSRKTKRTVALLFMISFTFSFLILSAIIAESQKEYERELRYLNIGGDIRVYSGYNNEFDENLEQNLRNFSSDIVEVTPVLQIYADSDILSAVGGGSGSFNYGLSVSEEEISYIGVNAIRPQEYLSVCQFKDKYFSQGSNENTILSLDIKRNGVLVDKNAADILGLLLGDNLEIEISLVYGNKTEIDLEIIGFFNILPGISFYERHLNILMNYEYFETDYNYIFEKSNNFMSYLVDVKDDDLVNETIIAGNLKDAFPNSISSANTLETAMEYLESSNSYTSVVDIIFIENLFILFIATCGLLILLYENFSERELEMAVMRSRGFKRIDLIKINFSEGLILMIYGLIIGTIGFFGAAIINIQLDNYIFEYYPLSRDYVVPLSLLWQILLAIGSMMILILPLSIYEVKKTDIDNLSRLLKI